MSINDSLADFLVVGGDGFLGKELLKHLTNDKVSIIGKSVNSEIEYTTSHSYKNLDISDTVKSEKFLSSFKFSHLVLLAWPKSPPHDSIDHITFASTCVNFVRIFKKYNPESRVVLTGSIHETGIKKGLIANDFICSNPFTLYGLGKKTVWDSLKILNVGNLCWVRFSNIYGPNDHPQKLIPSLILSTIKNEAVNFTNPQAFVDFINIKDAALGLFKAIISNNEGVINIGAGKGYFIQDIKNFIKQSLSNKIRPSVKFYSCSEFGPVLDISRAITELGYTPKSSIEDLADFIY